MNGGASSVAGSSGSNGEEPARTLKWLRLVWTPQLHKRFVDAVAHLGIKNAVPKTIMQLMSVDGLTRENVASHLQKYRLYVKRMQGLSNAGPSASDHIFASTPVPPSLREPQVPHAAAMAPAVAHAADRILSPAALFRWPGCAFFLSPSPDFRWVFAGGCPGVSPPLRESFSSWEGDEAVARRIKFAGVPNIRAPHQIVFASFVRAICS